MNLIQIPFGVCVAALAATTTVSAAEPEAGTPPGTPQNVTVQRKVRPQQTLIDRKVFKVSDELAAGTASAAEMLNTLPSVEVDPDGNLSLRGDRNVLILIDGKPSAQFTGAGAGDALLQFPASMIERVEVMTTPPAQYRAEGTGGVINIVTKKGGQGAPGGSAQASLGSTQRSVLGLSGNGGWGSVNLSGGLGLRHDVRRRTIDNTLGTPGADGIGSLTAHQHLDETAHRLLPSVRGALSWQLGPTQSLDADFNERLRSGQRYFDQSTQTTAPADVLQAASTRHSDGRERDVGAEQSLRWHGASADAASSLDLGWHHTFDLEREHYTYLNRSIVPPATLPTTDHLATNHDLGTAEWGADYQHTLASGVQWKLGLALTQDRDVFFDSGDTVDPFSGAAVTNPDITSRYEHRARVDAVYTSWQHSLEWASLVAGLRTEHTSTEGLQVTTGQRDHQDFRGWYPSLRAEHWIDSQASLSLGYGKRLSRPDPEWLNPFIDHQDIHNLRAGNPSLRPQETQAWELRYGREAAALNFDATAYVRNYRNSVTDVVQVLSADVALATKTNLAHNRTRGIEFSLDGSMGVHWGYRLSGDVYTSQIDATAMGVSGLRSASGLNMKGTLDFKPTATDAAQLNVSHVGRRLTAQGSMAPTTVVNVGFRHQINSQTAIVSTLSDIFNGQRQERSLVTPTLSQTYLRTQPGRVLFVGVSFTFGGGPKKGKAGFDYDGA